MSIRIRGAVVTPSQIISPGVLTIDSNGIIEEIAQDSQSATDFDFGDYLIVPGFIDLHVHGGGGADFMDGETLSARQIAKIHARHGTTTLLATTLTAFNEQINECIASVIPVIDSPDDDEARIAGFHLEGPYICAGKRGAQPEAPIRPPDRDEMQGWITRSKNGIKLITLAPELATGTGFIARAVEAGVVVSMGHTAARYTEALTGIDEGVNHATHLFNAMPPLHHRDPGAVGAAIGAQSVVVELIADGVHLHPEIVSLIYKSCGADRICLITDAISGADMPDGLYELGGTPVVVEKGMARFKNGTLAGSVLTMDRAFHNAQEFARISPVIASRMASLTAARQIGIAHKTGSLEVGKMADIAVLDSRNGDTIATMREGIWIYRS